MELKVWCDGIQRVVCGVSTQTTCQDVVFALAHATAQTGRFILIEKFRNSSERLLAPSEQPLQVLAKWGEYANDVTFVMKRSEHSGKGLSNLNATAGANGSHAGALVGGSPNRRQLFNDSIHRKSGFQQNSDSSTSSTAKSQSSAKSSPTAPTQTVSPLKANNSSHNNNNNIINNINTNTNDLKQAMNNKNNNNCAPSGETTTPTKSAHRPRHPPPYCEAISKSALITSGADIANTTTSHTNHFDVEEDDRSYNNKRRSVEPSPQSQSKQRTGSQKELLLHRDAIRLVDKQKETMKTQEKEMTTIDVQISSIERKLTENESLINRYKDQMECLHQLWLDQEVLIDQFDEQRLDADMDELLAKAQAYEEEVALVKRKLSKCETDIGDCRQRITMLMDELEDGEREARAADVAAKEGEQLEANDQLMTALRERNAELESQKNDLQILTNSIKQLDNAMNDKTSEADRLLTDLKEANIQGLALHTRAHESRKHASSSSAAAVSRQPFQHRSGSTRRMIGSPRELENAVATNKNPHGVWV